MRHGLILEDSHGAGVASGVQEPGGRPRTEDGLCSFLPESLSIRTEVCFSCKGQTA